MCGICGIHGADAASDAGRRSINAMLHTMARRGPDGHGSWFGDGIGLGHRRLAIVDLSERGLQPMRAGGDDVVISVNGEIYNYPELRAELQASGASFASDCDSEAIIHGWRRWGEASFERYNGMFAIALWNATTRQLYLVRDRLGIKPLYYWQDGARLLFASDIQAILAASWRKEWPVSATGLAQYLAYQNRFGAETMFEGIRMLRPGHWLRVEADGRATEHAYAQVATAAGALQSFDAAVASFGSAFRAAVKRHLMADVPVATYLSAGFDSSIVTSVAAQELPSGPTTFTGTFGEGGWYDEASGATLVAARNSLENTQVEIGAAEFRDHFDDLVFALEEPRMGTGALPQYLVAKQVAETHKIVLTGHGGDELFSGYPVFKFVLLSRLLRQSPGRALSMLREVRLGEWPHIVYFALSGLFAQRGRKFLPQLFSPGEIASALRPAWRVNVADAQQADRAVVANGGAAYRELLATYIRDYLPGLLVVEDKVSMAHGLESRTPFLDNELVAFALSINEETKLHGGKLKAITRAAARPLLPAELFAMPKRGFPNPLAKWLRGELSGWMQARIVGPNTPLLELFERRFLENAVKTYRNSWRRRWRPLDEIATHRMFMLLSIESWLRQTHARLGVRLVAPSSRASLP